MHCLSEVLCVNHFSGRNKFGYQLAVIGIFFLPLSCVTECVLAVDGNQLSYLQEPLDPYYVGREFPKLTTPQWVGETGVGAVVVLAIDDMRSVDSYESYLRPILERLKKIDGRAPVSIMTNTISPQEPQLRTWLNEGLTIDVHTIDHPCPCLADGDFAKAKSTYDRCIDLLGQIPGNQPVAFRMPCCDSQNTPSPRFWTEIFNRTTPEGNYLSIDSSVFNITTNKDRQLPASMTRDTDGRERFRKYLPFPSFVNTIEDYPYPYVIGKLCWEFPCVVPSDWEGQNLHQPFNPKTVEDLKVALDAVVAKQGVYNLVFHPHGWIRSDQIIELIDHAVEKYGKRIKFLNFREALRRINEHLLGGEPLRNARGNDNHVRLLDINSDGFLDVFRWNQHQATTRIWNPTAMQWSTYQQPWSHGEVQFTLHAQDETAKGITETLSTLHFEAGHWTEHRRLVQGDALDHPWSDAISRGQLDKILVRDLNSDGLCELLLSKNGRTLLLSETLNRKGWQTIDWNLPDNVQLATKTGKDAGLRFVDVNKDGFDDCLFSDAECYSLHLFESMKTGWSHEIVSRERRQPSQKVIPPFVRADGTNNGVWFHSGHLWIQNEQTNRFPDNVDRRSLRELLTPEKKETDSADSRWGGMPGPTNSKQALADLVTTEGFVVDLVASEPLVVDPIAFDWGPDGCLWVVEIRDYPTGMDGNGKPGGRVKVLRDDNDDGQYDRAEVFPDGQPFPTGVKVWRDGVLITAAPELFYAKDTDGDDVADYRKVLYHGFTEGNQQHRVNGMRWGLDGWIYLANGDSGGRIESMKTGKKVKISGRDLRIKPDNGAIDSLAGQTQFGRDCDDGGNWFGGNNSYPMWHYLMEDRYFAQNPRYAPPNIRKQVAERPGTAPVFPQSVTVERFNDFDRANRFTSACSPTIYRDMLIGSPYETYSFVCELVV